MEDEKIREILHKLVDELVKVGDPGYQDAEGPRRLQAEIEAEHGVIGGACFFLMNQAAGLLQQEACTSELRDMVNVGPIVQEKINTSIMQRILELMQKEPK